MQGNNSSHSHLIDNEEALVELWSSLYERNAPTSEVNEWVKYLPASYAQTLPDDVLGWLWSKSTHSVPDSLQHEKWPEGWPVETHLHVLHLARIRANELGIVDMRDFYKEAEIRTYEKLSFSTDDDFFTTRTVTSSARYDFCYRKEVSRLCKLALIDRDDYAAVNDPFHPHALRYVLRKWATGSWKTYQPSSKKLLTYAVKLIEELFKRSHQGIKLEMLEYYQEGTREPWVPGTPSIPEDLRAAVEEALASGDLLGLSNGSFIRNYYAVASEPILQKLHNVLSKRTLTKGSCVVL